MKSSEYLRKAKALIDSPEKWTKGANARNERGEAILYSLEDAICFCSLGAMCKITKPELMRRPILISYLQSAIYEKGFESISSFNDKETTTHVNVMSLFDRAIELAESEGD